MATAGMGDTITISYIGTLDDGTIFHSTEAAGPLTVTLGAGELFPALENAIVGMRPAETRNISLSAGEAYGPRLKENVIRVARGSFPAEKEIKPGQKLGIEFAGGAARVMLVTAVTAEAVTLDANHPLAGCNLTFALRLDQIAGKPDRYVSFAEIEGDKNSQELITLLRRHIDDPEKSNPFWEKFKEKLARVGQPAGNGGRCLDELFLVHSYINNIRELFEEYGDEAALNLLDQVERESC
ncbi:N(2)-fixation sustaining protein CowN [Geomonas subterranea]|uniref:N(2)-fixation sustaining protein CowN n=1 Tax=Geomonas subterranea TaxID=2847989 RepID=UPI001EF15BC9|nr:N(2)-fixation sustaining protein CowN [Geomonas subterranea]